MAKLKDLTGNTYGLLTVIEICEPQNRRTLWKCRCTCGNELIVRSDILPKKVSCGCSTNAHGESKRKSKTKEYYAWAGIKSRCYNQKHKRYKYYGAKGVRVCDRWLESYKNFLSDMGRAPSKNHSLDRKNVNGNYEPSNCRWATSKEQMNNTTINRMITINGNTKNLTQWCEYLKLDYKKIHNRLCKGWTNERALGINGKA